MEDTMKAFNSYLEYKLIDLKNSKFERDEFAKMGKYLPISNKQKREEEFNILICNFVLSDSAFLKCNTFRELSQYLNSITIEKFVEDNNINLGYVYSYIASLWSQFNAGNDL
jgi:hypothetical protein